MIRSDAIKNIRLRQMFNPRFRQVGVELAERQEKQHAFLTPARCTWHLRIEEIEAIYNRDPGLRDAKAEIRDKPRILEHLLIAKEANQSP
jgi:hypothetical protein